jgi:hypothetical protein
MTLTDNPTRATWIVEGIRHDHIIYFNAIPGQQPHCSHHCRCWKEGRTP